MDIKAFYMKQNPDEYKGYENAEEMIKDLLK